MDREHWLDIQSRLRVAKDSKDLEHATIIERWWAAHYYHDIIALWEHTEKLRQEAHGSSTDSG